MLNQLIDYTIIEHNDQTKLTDQVTQHMHDGWVPSGPLVIKDANLLQVMIKFGSGRA
jgi:hypothetical protein